MMLLCIEHKLFSFLVKGKWTKSSTWNTIVDPLNGEPFIKVAEIDETGIQVCLLIIVYTYPCCPLQTNHSHG